MTVRLLAITICCMIAMPAFAATVIDETAGIKLDERQIHAAWVGFSPADGEVAEVNPPRFSWPYNLSGATSEAYEREYVFTLQIARSPNFTPESLLFETVTAYNFFNAIPPLEGGRYSFWRVGRDVGTDAEEWSRTRTFIIEPWTREWDRSALGDLDRHLQGHPRIGFTAENLEDIRRLRELGGETERLYDATIHLARTYMEEDWFTNMPAEDPLVPAAEQRSNPWSCEGFRDAGRKINVVALAYMLTGDESYLAVREPLMVLASYPPGGESSPERLGPPRKWATKITMDMGLTFDWLYTVLTEAERETIAHSLDWRIGHIHRNFSWQRGGQVAHRGLAGMAGSHQYENALWTLVGALAAYEHSEAAREFAPLMLNYLCGVTNGFGQFESWNEGLSYGHSKLSTLLDAACWAAMTIPDLRIERNPYWQHIGRFFSFLTPLGSDRSAWGNYGTSDQVQIRGHQRNLRRLAFFTSNAGLLHNWQAANELRGASVNILQEYLMPYYYELPDPAPDQRASALLPIAGWAMAYSGHPGDPATYTDGVGITFRARPQGGYSHSFNSENAFDAFAYGSVIATGGGRKANSDRHAAHTMSHNAVLIDGLGQNFNQLDPDTETAGRIIAWHEEPGLVYWCGEATEAYRTNVPQIERALRHVLFVDDRYFVIFDDLAVNEDADPVRFSWLYHVHQDVPVQIDEQAASFDYIVGEANVRVSHLGQPASLEVLNLRGEDGYRNPITGEDMLGAARDSVEASPLRQFTGDPVWNNLWVNSAPQRQWQFLAAILPWREGAGPPVLEQLGERRFAVQTDAGRRTIFFGSPAEAEAGIVVDFERIRMLSGQRTPPEPGEMIWEADLSDTAGWVLDGAGSVETLDGGVVKINTDEATTFWAPQSITAPVVFDFEARTDDEMTRAIFFFMAEGPEGEDIFGWERPEAAYGDYAYTGLMELYTAGMLREGCGTEANFRRIGQLPDELQILRTPRADVREDQLDAYRDALRRFQPATIHDSAMDGYQRGTWARYQIFVDGGLVRAFVDGRPLFEVTYRDPLTSGRFGFRNFRADTSVMVRNLTVARPWTR